MFKIANPAKVRTASGTWVDLAVQSPDISNYSTTTQMNTAIAAADNEVTISSGSFPATTALNISNSLSDTYKFYNIYIYAECTTNAQDLRMKFRENITDKSTGYYSGGNFATYTGTTGAYANRNNGSDVAISSFETGHYTFASIKIFRPNATTGHFINHSWDNYTFANVVNSGRNEGMTNFNGVTLYTTSGTMTGYYILTGIKA